MSHTIIRAQITHRLCTCYPVYQFINVRIFPISQKYRPRLSRDPREIADEWRNNIERVRQDLETIGADHSHTLRYEDLVLAPEASLRAVCDFLQEAFDPAMLDYHRENRARGLEPADFLAWKRLTLSPLESSRVGRYCQDLDADEAALIVSRAGNAFSRYYDVEKSR